LIQKLLTDAQLLDREAAELRVWLKSLDPSLKVEKQS